MEAFIRRHKHILSFVLGLTLLLCGTAALLLYGRQQTLTCQRGADAALTCTQQISWFKLFPLEVARVIQSPHLAKTEINCHTDGETATYECLNNGVQLTTPTESVSLSGFFNETTARETVDRLNQFFDSTEQQLIVDSQNGIAPIVGLACVVVPYLVGGVLLLVFVAKRSALKQA